jgi:hypothetical protein
MNDHANPANAPVRKCEKQWQWWTDIHDAIRAVGSSIKETPEIGPMRWHQSRWHDKPPVQVWPVTYVSSWEYDAETRRARDWWRSLAHRDVHPAVKEVVKAGWMPDFKDGLAGIVLEYPTLSEDMRLAYTQSERKGKDSLRTVTTPGKYIKSRWTYLDDHYVRGIVARTTSDAPMIWHTSYDIVRSVQRGPRSCMKWGEDLIPLAYRDMRDYDEEGTEFWLRNHELHPYAAYAPQFGWRVAVRIEGREINARALVLHHTRGPYEKGETLKGSVYVRSYRRNGDCFSPADETLESWLQYVGVEKVSAWPEGTRLARVKTFHSRHDFLAPYIDGSVQTVEDEGDYLRLSHRGSVLCERQDGSYGESDEGMRMCEHCDDMADEDEGIWVGRNEDCWIGACCSDQYTYVFGRNRAEYYVHQDDVIGVGDTWYHTCHLGDNDIVELDNGDYCHEDYAFRCPINGAWYSEDEGQYTEDNDVVHQDNAWRCAGSDEWYSTNVDPVIVGGETYHQDHVPEDHVDEFDKPYDKPEGAIPNETQLPLPDLTHMTESVATPELETT